MKFPKLRAFFGLDDKSDVSAITDEQMTAAEGQIAQLETRATTAETNLATATASLTAAETRATTAEGEATTLRAWKKEQQAADGRTEDDSNKLDDKGAEAMESWERAAASTIANVKKRVGEK